MTHRQPGFRNDLTPGQLVTVTLPGGEQRRARLSEHAPYLHGNCDGWYVTWHPLPREQWESAGGWKQTRTISC